MKTSTLEIQLHTNDELEQTTLHLDNVDKILTQCGRNLVYYGKTVKPNLKQRIKQLIEERQLSLDLRENTTSEEA